MENRRLQKKRHTKKFQDPSACPQPSGRNLKRARRENKLGFFSRMISFSFISLFVGSAMTSQETLKVYESLSEIIQARRFKAGKDDEALSVQSELVLPSRGKMGETLESQVLQDTPPSESEH
jgi:hypothetical protein